MGEQTQQLLAHIDGSAYATDIPLGTKVDPDCAFETEAEAENMRLLHNWPSQVASVKSNPGAART